ncbi:exodeoxyribonuclease I [Cronobacter dublinensis]|uniref:Exodeoxyribonuclease I n=1 Tax=Cronobacter dublinensis TaxID=413497 RepID=A0A9Q4XL04_9ENTR|nr:exodeoxyribonuclease I [Cronobacter dublinensis]EGT5662535.1 exodeoxyribonuclease I [Cronobacter dublinensis subsp. dublinensis]EGT4358184.1 exodeoxyribonuclease I [Cronobacter dublinensis]EGT5671163.1 exodeoxyribonuclease I [Cronobacter dublinensis subsp. dublinensis]EGT5675192.1 exodeoxyribonuclease I [Cronobacter dublinensis subsp. dublinensis]EGT5679512.1 exodeoxyribonuclease I [Cronobacter dublinensis subsp. dublinensis]
MSDSAAQPTFLFHDYETFGKSPSLDRPAQFAALRTDENFNVIGEPEVFYCKPADDYLPQPEAVLITGITPQVALARGENEAEFARRIHALFTVPKTCVVGYNNVRFDDEVTRNIFYRNFYDPYAWSWQHDNSRWDLLDVMRACYALRPEGIVWPENSDGLPSFRLEHLTVANGIEHANAHDAMADVHATIAMAQLVKTRQPRMFDYLYTYRSKQKLATLIDIVQMKPLVHVSGMFGAWRGNTSWIAPIAWHPDNRNAVIVVDLAGDISPLLELDADALRERLYTPKAALGDDSAVPVKLVHLNKCPVLAQANTLRPEDAERLGIDRQHCLNNLKVLRDAPQVREKLVALFAEAPPFPPTSNVDAQLYDGFFSDADRAAMRIVLQTPPQNLPALDITFVDKRIEKLLFNYRARNFPGTLSEPEQQRWLNHRRDVFTPEFLQAYAQELEMLYNQYESDKEKTALLKALYQYAQEIVG